MVWMAMYYLGLIMLSVIIYLTIIHTTAYYAARGWARGIDDQRRRGVKSHPWDSGPTSFTPRLPRQRGTVAPDGHRVSAPASPPRRRPD